MSFSRDNKPAEWMHAELKRFKQQLPIEKGKNRVTEKTTTLVRNGLIELAHNQFNLVVTTLVQYIKDIASVNLLSAELQLLAVQSNLIVLATIERCFEQHNEESSTLSDDIVKKQLLGILCPLIVHPDASSDVYVKGSKIAGRIIYLISKHHFSTVFLRISRRLMTLVENNEDSMGPDDLELIRYVHVPVEGLIVLFQDCSKHFKNLKKYSQQVLLKGLSKSIWNWIESYPEQFTYLYKETNALLSELSEKLFTLTDQWSENTRKKAISWPLQILLLLLSPESIQEASGTGELSKGAIYVKRQFLENLKKNLSGSRSSSEHALLACVHLCKASTFINREDNIVCFLVSQVMNELKAMLFTAEKPFVSTTGLHVSDLMVDLYVASFRINYRNSQHFEVCFQPDSDPVFQTALVKGLHQIVKETPLKWWPNASVVYSKSQQVRHMFQQCIRRMTSYDPHLPKVGSHRSSLSKVGSIANRKKDDPTIPFEKEAELLLWLVKLFHADPHLALNHSAKCAAEIQASSMQFMNGLVIIMMFTNVPDVSAQVSETLLGLHSPENIELWNPEAPMATFWEISSQIVYNVADRLLSERIPNQLKAMRWLQKILKCRIQFIEKNRNEALIGTHNSICSEALSRLEMVFLTSLWSSDIDKVLLAMKCFGLLFEEACLLVTDRPSPIHPSPLMTVYYKFANEVQKTGRTALHKCILSILREVNVKTPGNIRAWELTLNRWQRMTHALTNYPREELLVYDVPPVFSSNSSSKQKNVSSPVVMVSDDALEIYISEWSKMTGFLCSLGGICCWKKNNLSKGDQLSRQNSKSTLEDSHMNRFLSELLTLLVCVNEHTSLQIISAVKESLGFDLSIPLYPSFFALCKATTSCFFDENGQVRQDSSSTLYVEQLIYVIRCILENKSDEVAGVLVSFDVEDVLLAMLKYIRSLNVNVQSLVIKSKMCQLVEQLMLRRADLSFRQEIKFRNGLVEYLTDWVLHASDKIQNVSKEILAISCSLDESAMRAIAILLKGLPLQPDDVEQELTEAKSQLFLKHFTLFMNILNKCYDAAEEKQNSSLKGSLAPHFVKLRESTVRAMSNMLSANIDSGLMHSISLGYHEDPQTRATFLEVLTYILKQGTEFESLAETVLEDRFERMLRLLVNYGENQELPIVMALCNSVSCDDMDEVARVLVNIFDSKGSLHVLLWNLFKDEVDRAEGHQTLFRGNTIASKAMTYSFKIYGSGYLHLLLHPIISEMTKQCGKSYEVDAARLQPGENKADNSQNVIELANKLMDKVKALRESFPSQLRSLCYSLNKAVQRRFQSSSYDAVSSAVFLRFINPAIVSPHSHGIVTEEVHPNVRRGLMLLSKILQNLANHLHFTKEVHMEIFNGFLENNFHRIHSYFREISSKPEIMIKEKEENLPITFTGDSNVRSIHKLLWESQETMAKYLIMERDSGMIGRDPFEKLVTLLAHLGPPENQPLQLTDRIIRDRANSIGWRFEDFMAKQSGQNQDELEQLKSKQLFYGDGKSKTGRPVFYYIARRYFKDEIGDDLLLYHILLTLQPKYGQPWDLVVDFTHTCPENRFKIETLARAFVILPEMQLKTLNTILFYNMNSSIRQYVELTERIMRPLKNHPGVVIIDKFPKFYEYILPDELKLPSSTTSLEKDTKVYSASKISTKGTVYIKVGPSSVQLQQAEKVKILGFSCTVNDVFYASEIKRASSVDEIIEMEFTTRRNSIKLFTTQAEEIANSMRHIQSRWRLSQPNKTTTMNNKKLRPKDVPGTLLNMSLVNLGNRDPSLRLAAYNLLCALTATFGLQINERLLEANGICIPANCTLFIQGISEQLAQREPNLTLEFLDECISCFGKSDDESRNLCLNYMAPWLPNLSRFSGCDKSDPNKIKMIDIIEKLIKLTIMNRQNYPFIQASVWRKIGNIPDLLDVVIDLFMKTSSAGGFGSEKAEVMADTTVTLASANVPLVSKKILERFHTVTARTNVSPTKILERHLMWDDIAILARYLLMLSFNDSLDVSTHLPDIFHIVTLLVSTGPVSLRASIHGLVINSLQSILTCSDMLLSDKTQLLIRTKLEDLSLQKFYLLFGISSVKSAPIKAFLSNKNRSRTFNSKSKDGDNIISLYSLEVITDSLLDVLEACMSDIKDKVFLKRWQKLCSGYAFTYNPAIQPRCIVVMGCICKDVSEKDVSHVLEVLAKASGYYLDHNLMESCIMCLAKYQSMLQKESRFHDVLFWVSIGILQMGEQNLYPAALCLLEENLRVCHSFELFSGQAIHERMMRHRNHSAFHWIFKQLDHITGLNFTIDFHFALTALLLKGLRHPSAKTKSSALRIFNMLLTICSCAETLGTKENFDVNKSTVAYLAALMPGSEEIQAKLNNQQPVYSQTLTLKRAKSKKIYTTDDKKTSRSPSVIITVSSTDTPDDLVQAKRRYQWESGLYNLLLDPQVLSNERSQVLLIVLLATIVDHTMDDFEAKTLYEVLAEASILYPEVFPIVFSILNRKLSNVISHSDDADTLKAAQTIVHSTSSIPTDKPTIKLQYLTGIGFHGLHSFPGPFVESSDPSVAPQMLARYIDAVLNKHSTTVLSTEGRSSSGQIFKAPSSVDDVIICSSSASLNAISGPDQTNNSTGSIFSVFKRVGSYSPARRQRKNENKSIKEK